MGSGCRCHLHRLGRDKVGGNHRRGAQGLPPLGCLPPHKAPVVVAVPTAEGTAVVVDMVVLGMVVVCKVPVGRELAEKDRELAEKDMELAERDTELAEKDRALAEKDKGSVVVDVEASIVVVEASIVVEDKALAEKDKALAEKDKEPVGVAVEDKASVVAVAEDKEAERRHRWSQPGDPGKGFGWEQSHYWTGQSLVEGSCGGWW